MKIRIGFVSNSSSTSFCIPCCLLTDEQKEMLLSLDQYKDQKKEIFNNSGIDLGVSNNNYPVNEEYHKIYHKMIKDEKWDDYSWDMKEIEEDERYICGSAMMWNGSINKLIEKIGIVSGAYEITNHGHQMVHMATHPESIKFFINMHKKYLKISQENSEEESKWMKSLKGETLETSPYELPDDKFEPLGDNSIEFEAEDDYCYVKDKVIKK